jgi:hypothetical protein
MCIQMSSMTCKLPKRQLYWAALCLGAVACSGSQDSMAGVGTEGPGTDVSRANSDVEVTSRDVDERPVLPAVAAPRAVPEPDTSFAGCLTVSSGREGSDPYYSLWTYDTATNVITEAASDEHGSVSDQVRRGNLYWKLDEAGRVSVRAGDGQGSSPFRQNTYRDEHGNPVLLRAVYLDALNLNDDDDGRVYSSVEYSNEYDDAGRLLQQSARASAYGTSFSTTYEHDAQGRCETITSSTGGVEHRDYDSTGRLWHRKLAGMSRGNDFGPIASTVTYRRDELGRLLSAAEVLDGHTDAVAQVQLEYRADGSLAEQGWADSDTGDGYSRRVWSSGCGELLSLLLRERGLACETDVSAAGDFRIF